MSHDVQTEPGEARCGSKVYNTNLVRKKVSLWLPLLSSALSETMIWILRKFTASLVFPSCVSISQRCSCSTVGCWERPHSSKTTCLMTFKCFCLCTFNCLSFFLILVYDWPCDFHLHHRELRVVHTESVRWVKRSLCGSDRGMMTGDSSDSLHANEASWWLLGL